MTLCNVCVMLYFSGCFSIYFYTVLQKIKPRLWFTSNKGLLSTSPNISETAYRLYEVMLTCYWPLMNEPLFIDSSSHFFGRLYCFSWSCKDFFFLYRHYKNNFKISETNSHKDIVLSSSVYKENIIDVMFHSKLISKWLPVFYTSMNLLILCYIYISSSATILFCIGWVVDIRWGITLIVWPLSFFIPTQTWLNLIPLRPILYIPLSKTDNFHFSNLQL